MKNIKFGKIALMAAPLLLLAACHPSKKQEAIEVTHTFPHQNWSYPEQVIDFPFTITDTSKDYRIEFTLAYDSAVNVLSELPVSITLVYPDSLKTYVSSLIDFRTPGRAAVIPTEHKGSERSHTLVAFPKKKLNQPGNYRVSLYRKAEKYDNYGFNSLTLRVVPADDKRK